MGRVAFKREPGRLPDTALEPFTGEPIYDNLLRHWREVGVWRARLPYDEYLDRCSWDLTVGRTVALEGERGGRFCSEKCRDEYTDFMKSRGLQVVPKTVAPTMPGCSEHPDYQAKRRPRTGCESCWDYFRSKHGKRLQQNLQQQSVDADTFQQQIQEAL